MIADISPDTTAVPLRVAAERLGLSRHAVRQRIRRGTLRGSVRDGRRFVWLPADPSEPDTRTPPADTRADTGADAGGDLRALVAHLEEEIGFLRRLTEHQAGRLAELERRLLVPVGAEPPHTDRTDDAEPARAPARRRWWLWWRRD